MSEEIKTAHPSVRLQLRKMQFQFVTEIPRYWSAGDPVRTHFANAFSILLPEYERLFISTLSPRLSEMQDPLQREQGRLFCAQEGQHAALHRRYNRWLVSLGYSAVPNRADSSSPASSDGNYPAEIMAACPHGRGRAYHFLYGQRLSEPPRKMDPRK